MLDDDRKLILFNTSKKVFKNNCTVAHAKRNRGNLHIIYLSYSFPSLQELFTPSTGFKVLHNRLKVHWTVRQQRDEITFDRLKTAALIIFGLPRDKFSLAEVRRGEEREREREIITKLKLHLIYLNLHIHVHGEISLTVPLLH